MGLEAFQRPSRVLLQHVGFSVAVAWVRGNFRRLDTFRAKEASVEFGVLNKLGAVYPRSIRDPTRLIHFFKDPLIQYMHVYVCIY